MNKNFWTKAEIAIKRFWFKITGQKRKYFRVGKCLRCGKCCRNIGILLEGKKIKKCMTNDLKFAEIIQTFI